MNDERGERPDRPQVTSDALLHQHAQHHLLRASQQLEQWTERLARERSEPEPTLDEVLVDLRHALEHLREAVLDDDDIASAGDESRITRPLGTSSDSRLRLEPGGSLLCDLIELAEVERRARMIVTTADALLQEAEDWVAESTACRISLWGWAAMTPSSRPESARTRHGEQITVPLPLTDDLCFRW